MTGEMRPLPLWPHSLSDEQLAMVKRAKLEVDPPFTILPSPAVPGSPGRVLAFGEVPPFLSEIVLIAPENVNRYESILGAMRFWLTAPPEAPPSISEAQWLSHVMGCEVKEVTSGGYLGEVEG